MSMIIGFSAPSVPKVITVTTHQGILSDGGPLAALKPPKFRLESGIVRTMIDRSPSVPNFSAKQKNFVEERTDAPFATKGRLLDVC